MAGKMHPQTIHCATIELRHDSRDGRYRWFEMGTDGDTEVSGATPTEAWTDARQVWRAPTWRLKRLSPTVADVYGVEG